MKDEDKTKVELIKELKTLRKERGKSALNDITERKQAEEKLIKNEKTCKEIQSIAHIGLWDYKSCDDIITWSDELYSIFEINKDAGPLSIEDFLGHIHPEDRDNIRKQIEKGENYRSDYRIVMNNGSVKHIHEETLIERQEDGKIVLMKGTAQDITKRKQAEEELRDSEERLKILFEYAPDASYINDSKGKFIDGNKAAERLVGYKREELIGKSFLKLKLLSTNDMLKAAKVLAKNIMGQPTGPDEFVLNRKDSSKVTVEISNYPVKIKGKTLMLGIARDITERKQSEEELTIITERLELAMDAGEHGFWDWNLDTDDVYFSPRYYIMLGYEPGELPMKLETWINLLHPEDRKTIVPRVEKYVENAEPYEIEFRLKTKEGDWKWISGRGKSYNIDKNGISHRAVGVHVDITERKKAEEKIKHLNLVLRAIRSVNQLVVKEKDREKLLHGACNNLVETRGYYSAWIALLNESGKLKTYAEAGIGKAILPMVEMLTKGESIVCGQKALKQQGIIITENPASACTECPLSQKYSDRAGFTIRLEHNGKVFGLMSVSIPAHLAVDQEEQGLFKEIANDIALGLYNIDSEKERKQAEDKYRKLIKTTSEGFWLLDSNKRTIEVNQSLCDMLGYTRNEMIGKTPIEFVDTENKKIFKEQTSTITNTTHRTYEISLRKKDGINFPTIFNATTLVDEKGETKGSFAFVTDITKRKQAEGRLKKTMDATIDTMSKIIEVKDPYTAGHQKRVSRLATAIAKELNLSPDKIEGIRIASLIHDIGKISVPTEILSKSTTLSDLEFSLIKEHSQTGYDILKPIDFSYPVAQIVLQHHERINGTGYPNNLKGGEILPEAKIMAVADVVEAMSSHRPYRPALGINKALEEISENRGILYDPKVVDVCLKLFKEKGFEFK